MVEHDDEDKVKIGTAQVISREVKRIYKTTKGSGSETESETRR